MVFAYFLAISPRNVLEKFSSCQVCFFCLVLSVLGFGLTTSCVCCLFFFSFSFKRQSSGLTGHHTPPALAVVFLVFSPPLCFVSPVLAVRPFCSGVSSGCHSGPRAVFGFSRDCSEAFFLDARRQRRLFVFWSVVFPVLRLHAFLGGPAPARRKAGPWVLALAPRPSEGGRHCPSRAAGLRPLPVRFANLFCY